MAHSFIMQWNEFVERFFFFYNALNLVWMLTNGIMY